MICDQCGHNPCETLTFCGVLRDHERSLATTRAKAGNGAVPTGNFEPRCGVAGSTLDAAEYVSRSCDPGRLRRFLAGRSEQEKAAILKYLSTKDKP